MSFLPGSVITLTPANVAFLEASLANLGNPRCVIQGPSSEIGRNSIRRALQGEVPVIDAAAALAKGHEDNHIRHMQEGLFDPDGRKIDLVQKVSRYPLGEISDRFGNTPPAILRFLAEHPAEDLEIAEVTMNDDDGTLLHIRDIGTGKNTSVTPEHITALGVYFPRFDGLYQDFIHPKGSRTWRFLPLPLLVGVSTMIGGEKALGMQFTAAGSTLDEMRDLMNEDKRPVCIGSKPDIFEDREDGLDKPGLFAVHGTIFGGYRMLGHDLSHVLIWYDHAAEGRQDMVQVYDSLMTCLRRFPPEFEILTTFHLALDAVLDGYLDQGRFFGLVQSALKTAGEKNKDLTPEMAAAFLEDFLQQLRTDFAGHPRREQVLGEHA